MILGCMISRSIGRIFTYAMFLIIMTGCQMFGGADEEEMSDMGMGEEENLLADTAEDYSETYNEAGDGNLYSDDSYGADSAVENDYSMDGMDSSMSQDYASEGSSGSSSLAAGSVYFVVSQTDVVSSPDGTGSIVFSLGAGDTVRAEPVGEYAMIGASHYVPLSSLSQSIVERIPESNAWR